MAPALRTAPVLAALLAAALLAAGCGGRDRAAAARPGPAPAGAARTEPAPPAAEPVRAAGDSAAADVNQPELLQGAANYTSPEGGFTALFPAGCGRIHTRISPRGADESAREIVNCYCDLARAPNTGVLVSVHLTVRDEQGGPPGPPQVTKLIDDITKKHGLQVVQQGVLTRKDVEGVRVFCRQSGSTGEMWIQGMLAGERIYVMSAWRQAPGSLSDVEIQRFFESFRLD